MCSVILAAVKMQETNIYKNKKIYCSIAGSGDPWSSLTQLRRWMLLALHDGLTIERLSEVFNMSDEQIISELQPLKESNLVKVVDNKYTPDFFISNLSETKKVYSHSKSIGKALAEALLADWDQLEQSFSQLSFSKAYSLKEQGFMFVGARILDLGVLGALARDKTLLEAAPTRPSPERPDGRYYFWMVEGEPEHLGKYGQDDTDLSWTNWHLLNFGQTMIGGIVNLKRRAFEAKGANIIKSKAAESPESLAKILNVPFLSKEDSNAWAQVSRQVSGKLLNILKEKTAEFRNFYSTLKASQYANNSFGEFFCWYYHLAYAWAIDELQEREVIIIPPEHYCGLVMYREGQEGLLSK
jgi:hypothetical protein